MATATNSDVLDDAKLAARIRSSKDSEHIVSTTLKTDQRVIARVTDGIYRQPGSAIRELISNAYDADATRVVIKTDVPRFDRISIEDNGHGMSPEALAYLLLHIGGSAKRSSAGENLGVTAAGDPFHSPGGRRLIGKIGIGLFSVSQLTHTFQVITKEEGESYRTVATVALKQYADEDFPASGKGKSKYESGKVNIWREKAADKFTHGTTIILTSIRPQARDTLRSREIWSAIEQHEATAESEDAAIEPPRFHIGRVDSTGKLLTKIGNQFASIPWEKTDSPKEAFRKLVQSVWDESEHSNPNPQLNRIFDYYLRMVWQLSLAVPLPYVDGHLFDESLFGWADGYELSNLPKGAARRITPIKGDSIRKALMLKDPANSTGKFDIFFDDLKLFRPIKYKGLPTTSHALKKPLVFFGKCRETFPKVPMALSGGHLAFEAYLFWTPKVVPTEHQGALIRIHGSSGTLFDPTFMRYQVAELSRLRQITCEIFVREGLDSALNIDRESFNNAHPHSVYITKWLHSALRQLATVQKKLASEIRQHSRVESKDLTVSTIQRVAIDTWEQEAGDPASKPPAVEISDTGKKTTKGGAYVFARSAVLPQRKQARTTSEQARAAILEEKLKAIAQILASFGLLDAVSKSKQEKLLKAIYKILDASEK
jgi:hypothetical protein